MGTSFLELPSGELADGWLVLVLAGKSSAVERDDIWKASTSMVDFSLSASWHVFCRFVDVVASSPAAADAAALSRERRLTAMVSWRL